MLTFNILTLKDFGGCVKSSAAKGGRGGDAGRARRPGRVQQLLLARVEDTLKPYGLTFAAYEALRLLAFTRAGALPMGKLGTRLMVHPAAVTNAIGRLEQRGLVQRAMGPGGRRQLPGQQPALGKTGDPR